MPSTKFASNPSIPDLAREAVEKMLVQHLMTERIFRKIFNNPDFTRRNVIATEIEKVIESMTEKEFSRDAFLQSLDHFYRAIESAAEVTEDYSEKQKFINEVYQRFFQGYSPKEADTHGIVYTPQPIVDFRCAGGLILRWVRPLAFKVSTSSTRSSAPVTSLPA